MEFEAEEAAAKVVTLRARDAWVVDLVDAGMTMAAVARQAGIVPERVRQIVGRERRRFSVEQFDVCRQLDKKLLGLSMLARLALVQAGATSEDKVREALASVVGREGLRASRAVLVELLALFKREAVQTWRLEKASGADGT